MRSVTERWREVVDGLDIRNPSIPVILNTTGQATSDADTIRRAVVDQVASPVNWRQSLECAAAHGANGFVECGDSTALTLFCRKTVPAVPCIAMRSSSCLGDLRQHGTA
jgi:[acyl-carrier-protein] S-malonyltransferase